VWGGIGRRTRLAKTAVEAKKRLSTRHRASVRSPESEKQKRDLGCWGHPGAGEVIVGRGVRRRTVRSTVDGRRTTYPFRWACFKPRAAVLAGVAKDKERSAVY
jgi:hypothetical protein